MFHHSKYFLINKEAMKNCTPEQKAACAKSGKECSSHAKADKASNDSKAMAPVAPAVQ